jgi:hypothetical protein
MTSSPRQAGTSRAPATYRNRISSTPAASSVAEEAHNDWLENLISLDQDLGPSHSDPPNQRYGFANDISQYQDLHRNNFNSHAAQGSELLSPFASRTEHELLRGMANYAAQSNPGTQNAQVGVEQTAFSRDTSSPYNMTPHSMPESTPPFPMEHTASPSQPTVVRQTKYEPFRHLFHTSEQARDHRRRATRFDRIPYCDPESDLTLADI